MIVIFVPIFDVAVYPLFEKIGLLKKQLQRIAIGLLFAVASFLIAALLEYLMQKESARLNPTEQLRILNLLPCNLEFKTLDNSLTNTIAESTGAKYEAMMLDEGFAKMFTQENNYQVRFKMNCANKFTDKEITITRNATLETSLVIIRPDPADTQGFKMLQVPFSINKQQIVTS